MKRRGGICIFVDEDEVEQMIEQTSSCDVQHSEENARGTTRISFRTSVKQKSKKKSFRLATAGNKCLYCGADIKPAVSTTIIRPKAARANDNDDDNIDNDDVEDDNMDFVDRNRKNSRISCNKTQKTKQTSRNRYALSFWHKSKWYQYKNRKQALNRCQCGATGEL